MLDTQIYQSWNSNYHDFTTDGTSTWGNFFQSICEWIMNNVPHSKIKNIHIMRVDGKFITGNALRISNSEYIDKNNFTLAFSNITGIGGTLPFFEIVLLGYSIGNGVGTQISQNVKISSNNSVVFTSNISATISARTLRAIW